MDTTLKNVILVALICFLWRLLSIFSHLGLFKMQVLGYSGKPESAALKVHF